MRRLRVWLSGQPEGPDSNCPPAKKKRSYPSSIMHAILNVHVMVAALRHASIDFACHATSELMLVEKDTRQVPQRSKVISTICYMFFLS